MVNGDDPLDIDINAPIEEEKDEMKEETSRKSPKKKQYKIYSDVMHHLDTKAMR